jgi:hypothetical protein
MGKKINVLFAPGNTASMPDITLQALNKLPDIEAFGVSYGSSPYWSFGKGWSIIERPSFRSNPVMAFFRFMQSRWVMMKSIYKADILMWHWDINLFDYYLVKLMSKPIFVEWIGSDIRSPDTLFPLNPYYKIAWENGDWDYPIESATRSRGIQKKFKELNALPMVCVEISLFIDKSLFPHHRPFFQRIDLSNYVPVFPDPEQDRPVLVHTPSATGTKGTRYVREIIEQLRSEGYTFEYIEIHGKPRQEALNAIQKADLFIDQFIVGSYGLATCEAMAMGKPVFCYIMPSVADLLPPECPIVNSTYEELRAKLITFINDPMLRNQTGKQGRLFAEKYHDADKIALELHQLFIETLTKG